MPFLHCLRLIPARYSEPKRIQSEKLTIQPTRINEMRAIFRDNYDKQHNLLSDSLRHISAQFQLCLPCELSSRRQHFVAHNRCKRSCQVDLTGLNSV